MSFEIEMILLLSLFSPLAEAFPNLYMSWWAPSNGKLQKYIDTWLRRVIVVFTVWIPILIVLSMIIKPPSLIWVVGLLVFSAFGIRLHVFDQFLSQELKKKGSATKPSKTPEFLYFIAFSSIGIILYSAVPNNAWLVPVAILTIFLGASMMSTFRRGEKANLNLDVIGRLIFVTGFLLNLYNLIRAAEAVV
jgi:hypothetical protein